MEGEEEEDALAKRDTKFEFIEPEPFLSIAKSTGKEHWQSNYHNLYEILIYGDLKDLLCHLLSLMQQGNSIDAYSDLSNPIFLRKCRIWKDSKLGVLSVPFIDSYSAQFFFNSPIMTFLLIPQNGSDITEDILAAFLAR